MGSKVTIELTRDQLVALLDLIESAEDQNILLTELQRSAKIDLQEYHNQEVLSGRI